MTTSGTLKGLWVVGLFVAVGFSCNDSNAQVSVYTEPESDAIVFENYEAKTIVVPKTPGVNVSIPSGFGYDSTFSVRPGGYVTRTYEVDQDD